MNKWETLEHNGPIFPKEYEYIGFDKNLSPLAEEMLYHYSAKLETEYVQNSVFNSNFWAALKKELPSSYQTKKFPEEFLPLCKEIFTFIQEAKETRKQKTKEHKQAEKEEKEIIKEKYGWAILNGDKQPIASPYIEGPGIFIARGKHPQLGGWKYRVKPEDVTINSSVHIAPPSGHSWKACEENKNSNELCSYKMKTSTGKILNKRILFSATSIVKQNADQKKFEKAIKLIDNWDKLKKHITYHLCTNKDSHIKQIAMVSYLIMNLGIRVGDEKKEDLADTVGASSLRKEHIKLNGNILELDFDGKDSVHYSNKIQLPDEVHKEFLNLLENKNDKDSLFPDVTSGDVKDFISSIIKGISAKVFRTAWGSSLLTDGLQKVNIKPGMSILEKVALVNNAQLLVAQKLNHQRNIGKNFESKSQEMSEKLIFIKNEFISLEKELNIKIQMLKTQLNELEFKDFSNKDKLTLQESYLNKIAKLETKLSRKKKQIKELELKLDFKDKTKNIAIGTSRSAYCDPRISVSFCKTFDIPLEKIYNKSMQGRFSWSLETNPDFYKTYPIIKE